MPEPCLCYVPNSTAPFCIGVNRPGLLVTLPCYTTQVIHDITELEEHR
jgi:hypothetical protein